MESFIESGNGCSCFILCKYSSQTSFDSGIKVTSFINLEKLKQHYDLFRNTLLFYLNKELY